MKKSETTIVAFVAVLTIVIASAAVAHAEDKPTNLLANAEQNICRVKDNTPPIWQKVLNFKKVGKQTIAFRAVFQVENPKEFVSLSLVKPLHVKNMTLNGKAVPKPLDGMRYTTIPGISTSMLKKGENILQARWPQHIKIKKHKDRKSSLAPSQVKVEDLNIRLLGLTPSALKFQTGPVLGYAGETFFTVTVRVNIPAEVVLEVNGKKYVSKRALLHSFKVEGLSADTQYQYSLKARVSSKSDLIVSAGPYSVRTLPKSESENFSFVIFGDSRSRPKAWAKVAAAVEAKKPAFTVFVGDMVNAGRTDHLWDEKFFGPAKKFFATVPFFAVIGNHEENCPLFPKTFPTPDGSKNWSQKIGSALFIGINGRMDFSSGSELTKWLEGLLAKSKAKFIFLSSHYPAWSSGSHGRLGKDGRPRERSFRHGQDVIMPLLKKYNAAAMFAGHDHIYERSEPTNGVSLIIAGGAGAPLYNKVKNAKKQNP